MRLGAFSLHLLLHLNNGPLGFAFLIFAIGKPEKCQNSYGTENAAHDVEPERCWLIVIDIYCSSIGSSSLLTYPCTAEPSVIDSLCEYVPCPYPL